MAGHLLIDKNYRCESERDTRYIRKLVNDVRNDIKDLKETDDIEEFESKYIELPRDYFEKGDTSVSMKHVDVPESIAYGNRATLEIHWRGAGIRKIYLVA